MVRAAGGGRGGSGGQKWGIGLRLKHGLKRLQMSTEARAIGALHS